jgi:hypothetical protein
MSGSCILSFLPVYPGALPVHRQSPVEDGYFAHAIPGQIDSPRMRPAIASEMHSELRRAIRCSF